MIDLTEEELLHIISDIVFCTFNGRRDDPDGYIAFKVKLTAGILGRIESAYPGILAKKVGETAEDIETIRKTANEFEANSLARQRMARSRLQ